MTTVRMGMSQRTAVSISSPTVLKAKVPHDVDDLPVGEGHLGAHGQAEAVAELGGLAPADETAGIAGLPERGHVLAGAARLVGDHGGVEVDGVHQVPDHAVGVEWAFRRTSA